MGGPVTAIGRPNPNTPQKTVGGVDKVIVSDDITHQALKMLVEQGKEMNHHLRMMTGDSEIGDDLD